MPAPYSIARQDSAIVAAAEILGKETRNINRHMQGVIDSENTAPLHNLRVSMRRLRAAIRWASPFLRDTYATHLDNKFALLSANLGPARDFDAWLEYLQSEAVKRQLAGNKSCEAYVSGLIDERRQRLPAICFQLESSYNAVFRNEVDDFINVQLPGLVTATTAPAHREFGGQKLYRHYRKLVRLNKLTPGSEDEQIHEIRKKCRRVRYWTEFMLPVAGEPASKLARYLKRVTSALGTIRDIRLHLARLNHGSLESAADLSTWLSAAEKSAWKKYTRAWERLNNKDFKRKLKRDLVSKGHHND